MTGYVLEKIYLEHKPGPGHPESPERLLVAEGVIKNFKTLKKIKARAASPDEICLIHDKAYFNTVKATQGHSFISLDPDTQTSAKSFEAAVFAAGGVLNLIDLVFNKDVENGFAFVRPPGHHAEKDKAMGFCLFNNVAIGAAYAIKKYKLSRVLVLDLDLHHGNGTQQAFYPADQVMYISTHQYPYYPGTGSFEERGEGQGEGYNINLPLSPGKDDDFYNKLLEKVIIPVAGQYQPEFILVSMGFDTYYQDPLGGMKVTAKGYAGMAGQIFNLAERVCGGKLIYVLEGGYNLQGIKEGTKAVLQELILPSQEKDSFVERSVFIEYHKTVKKCYKRYWRL
ncbi:MAG: histone deacetylase [Patescibacteria group bacterium]